MRRLAPRPLNAALEGVVPALRPATALARVQEAWPAAAGELVAEEAHPVSERGGVVTVSCRSSVWAQELELLSAPLLGRLNELIAAIGSPSPVTSLRFVAGGARRPSRAGYAE